MNFWEKAVRFVYGFCWHPTVFGDTDSHDGDAGSVGPHGVSSATVGVSALAQDTDPLGPHGVSATTVGVSALAQDTDSLGPHGVSAATVGVSALAQDLFNFEITSQVPEGLSNHVVSKKKAQASCYKKLLVAWKASNPPPKTPEEASRLVLQTLKQHLKADVEGLLKFYGLPLAPTPVETTVEVPVALPQGVEFELQTLPVEARCVTDGDGITVYVSTSDPRELHLVPQEVPVAALKRSEARARGEKTHAKELHKSIIAAGYQVINVKNEEVLARKYRIRLRGIDAPEGDMPYGKEAKEELAKIVQGKCLRVLVYGEDQYGRSLGDIYCNGNFVQELMLKKGMAWHYKAYDQRAELAKCEKNARAKRVGLWASPNPEEPWEWRKKNK